MKKVKLFENKRTLAVYIVCNTLTLLTILAEIVTFLVLRNDSMAKIVEHIGLCILAMAFYNLPLILRLKASLQIPSFLQITVMVFAIAHFVLGDIAKFYDHSLVFDKLLHTTSGIIFAIVGFSLVNGLNSGEKPLFKLSPFFVAVFSFCFALAIGYLWELFEFSMDSIFGANMQRWQDSFYAATVNGEECLISNYGQGNGIIDTMGDMIVNMVGAIIISVLGYVWLKKKSKIIDSLLIIKLSDSAQPDVNVNENGSV